MSGNVEPLGAPEALASKTMKRHLETSEEEYLEPAVAVAVTGAKKSKQEVYRMACNQTAVAVLQELCMKKKWDPPIYENTDVSGAPNDPMFEVSVTLFNGVKGVGRGRQKKAAKHDAAKKALAQLQVRALPDINVSKPRTPEKEPINPHEDIGGSNPVGELQNLCSAKHFPAPVYTVIADVGEPHEKVFTMRCTVSERNATGTAKKKQLAKHFAALNMLRIMQSTMKPILDEIPNDPAVSSMYSKVKDIPVVSFVSEEEKKNDLEVLQKYTLLKRRDDIPTAPLISPGTKFTDYHLAYAVQLTEYRNVKEKPEIKHQKSYFKKLEMIADELHLNVFKHTTFDSGFGINRKHIVFVHLETDPPVIQAGHNQSEDIAIEQAAHNVIDFLDIMLM